MYGLDNRLKKKVKVKLDRTKWGKRFQTFYRSSLLKIRKERSLKTTAAAAKSSQSCPTLGAPIDAAHQAPLSLGLSRQEHWSELPFPSPKHESEK